ncbi:MAG TPA: hypothetical protein VE133_01165 [Candidatus Sulfotelmatobacter sp.]|nr:hypothetical protein [Candidatus Sulfotelmatobacter sp.]
MANRTIAAFGLGEIYPPNLAKNMSALQKAGWTAIIAGLFHIDASGNLYINDTQITNNAQYIGSPDWPGQLQQLLKGPGSTITTLEASIGGWGVNDFSNVKTIYEKNNKSFAGTLLQKTFQLFFITFPMIRLIDMDMENTYDQPSFVAFCQMLIQIGFGITFCPYTQQSFWTGSLAALNKSNPGAVKWWNLQCYAGGGGNDPKNWAAAITSAIPGFNTNSFLLASDWSRNLNQPNPDPSTWYWEGDCPPAMQGLLATFAKEPCISGAFVWNIDQILNYAADQKKKPDPNPCGVVGMTDYVAAVKKALG